MVVAERIFLWGFFTSSEPGFTVKLQGVMDGVKYMGILQENLLESALLAC